STPLGGGAPLLSIADDETHAETVNRPTPEVASLTEILAGLSLHRRLIGAAELSEWFDCTLGVRGELFWDVARAWVEAGGRDPRVYGRWRCRAFMARRPRFVVSVRPKAPSIFAVLQGLTPFAVEREVERAAERLGAVVQRFPPAGPLLPIPLVLRAPS